MTYISIWSDEGDKPITPAKKKTPVEEEEILTPEEEEQIREYKIGVANAVDKAEFILDFIRKHKQKHQEEEELDLYPDQDSPVSRQPKTLPIGIRPSFKPPIF